ncbi:anthranilate N-benzoyltransferase protein 1 [Brachypodium distachyon]|uniref:Uncharacterized protein n=1 Tax=Brachypodium distachyon TaxID=15368 RepID=I1II45_BRADI|nr:anthranilate N-benzoyltransferase protein 1 [Brachypodium distachyon]KQJ86595.1 hypothetical protein BRADI_4g06550v3 [Brachypodium distachyon]PNT62658.1 hypothetical protein BRADI_4g06550v3 [Brachypodium distachyon]|eukprot:XP_003575487.3 anthranilate N-benzoyltransferase protein 1 [Brachypodium distachyon]
MAGTEHGSVCSGSSMRVVSRRLVKASDTTTTTISPRVVAFTNLDLLNDMQLYVACLYRMPATSTYSAVAATFEAHMPSFLNHMFPMAGRIVRDPVSGLPEELRCGNQGAELVLADAGVALRALDWSLANESVRKILVPFPDEVPLSLQLVSFTCGLGFAVVWGFHHLLGDGSFGGMLMKTWCELVMTGSISGGGPSHDRAVFFRPRDPPSYSASFAATFTPWDHEHQVNGLTAEASFVQRHYYVEGRDVARLRDTASTTEPGGRRRRATRAEAVSAYLWKVLAGVVASLTRLADDEKRCRMAWLVDGRRRLTLTSSTPELRRALRSYAGNVTTHAVGDAAVAAVLSRPLAEVAAMVRDAITAPDYDALCQETVDWVEAHKRTGLSYAHTVALGLGSPTLAMTVVSSEHNSETDFGFGPAVLGMPVDARDGRLCTAHMYVTTRPADGSWIVNAYVWPRLAAALEADEGRVFRPITAEYLGLGECLPPEARPRL